jgi:hypothetical protein
MLPQHRFPSLLIAFAVTLLVAGLILPETYLMATAEPAAVTAPRPPVDAVLPRLPPYIPPAMPEAIAVSRDPFESPSVPSDFGEGTAAAFAPSPGAAGQSDPNAAATVALLATALGARPCALVRDAGAPRLVRVGDRLRGSKVRAVGLGTLTLDDGTAFQIGSP